MNINFEEISRQADITKVVGHFLKLKRKGKIFLAVCPFHDDHEPSMNIEPTKQIYKCFSCGAGGGVVKFVKEFKKCSYLDAAREVIKICGIDDSEGRLITNVNDTNANKPRDNLSVLSDIYKDASDYYHYVLKNTKEGQEALEWLKNRKVSEEQTKRFFLGYSSSQRSDLTDFLLKKGYQKADVLKSNLTIVNKVGELKDFFWQRVIYPIRDKNNRITGFIGRTINNDSKGMKYLALSDSPLFKKSSSLFNIENAIMHQERVYIVEGIHDALRLDYFAIKNTVAILGTLLSFKQIEILKNFKEVVLLLDSDNAGQEASKNIKDKLLNNGIHVLELQLETTKDPDSYFLDMTKDEVMKVLENVKVIEVSTKTKVIKKATTTKAPIKKQSMLLAERHIILCMFRDDQLIERFLLESNAWMISSPAREILDYLVVVKDILKSNSKTMNEEISQIRTLLSENSHRILDDIDEELKVTKYIFTNDVFEESIKILRKRNRKDFREHLLKNK